MGVALGNGDGSFTAAPEVVDDQLASPAAIVATDLNGDGNPDLIVGSASPIAFLPVGPNGPPAFGSLLVFLGRGGGTFSPPSFRFPLATGAVGVADFNGDRIPDLVTVDAGPNPSYRVFIGKADGTFTAVAPVAGVSLTAPRVVTADFDGDGHRDFAGLDANAGALVVYYGIGNGTFTQAVVTPLGGVPADLAVGDFDGDGRTDVVVAENGGVVFHRNQGGRRFDPGGTAVIQLPDTVILRVSSADFDGNGLPDVVAVDRTQAVVAFGNPGGVFIPDPGNPYPFPAAAFPVDVGTGDADGDQNPDFVVVRGNPNGVRGDGQVYLNLAPDRTRTVLVTDPNPSVVGQTVTLTATVSPLVPPFPAGTAPSGTVSFSTDGTILGSAPLVNGTATVTVTDFTAGTYPIVAVYSGDPRFLASTSPPVVQVVRAPAVYQYEVTGLGTAPGVGADRVASGSFNSDGVPDIVLGSGFGKPALVTVVDGQTRQVVAEVRPFGDQFSGGVFVAAGDIDGDGVADVAVTADTGGGPRVRVFLTRGTDLVPAADFFALDPTFRGGLRVALGDLNRDGFADLVVTGGPGAGPRVATYDGRSLLPGMTPTRLRNDFFALDPDTRTGLFVAVGDLNGDGIAEIVVGADAGGGPRVSVFDGSSVAAGDPQRVADFFAGPADDRGGVRVAVRDVTGDGIPELITGAGSGSGSTVRCYDGPAVYSNMNIVPLLETDAFPGLTGGVYVA